MTIESPKVTRSGGRMSSPRVRLRTTNWSAQPIANMIGMATSSARNGLMPSAETITRIR